MPCAMPGSRPLPGSVGGRARAWWHLLLQNRMAMTGAAVILAWVVIALLSPVIAPYDPIDQNVRLRLQGPSAAHWFGVDGLGRDVFSRVLWGGRVSLPVASIVVLVATVLGTLYGGLSAFAGKVHYSIAMLLC